MVKARRKPTSVVYVLNQLARRHADDLAALVDVGRDLARAQRRALRGEAGRDLRNAIGLQRAVIAALTAKTATLMKELGVSPAGHLDEVATALQAALVDPAVCEKLEERRLEKVPAPAAGFPGRRRRRTRRRIGSGRRTRTRRETRRRTGRRRRARKRPRSGRRTRNRTRRRTGPRMRSSRGGGTQGKLGKWRGGRSASWPGHESRPSATR